MLPKKRKGGEEKMEQSFEKQKEKEAHICSEPKSEHCHNAGCCDADSCGKEHHDESCCHGHAHEEGCGCSHGDAKFDRKTVAETVVCLLFAAAGIAVQSVTAWYYALPFFLVAYFVISYPVLRETLENVRKGQLFDENSLMTIATIGAFFLREFPEAVGVMLFFRIGELIQGISVGKSRRSIHSLMAVRPDFARVLRNGNCISVSPAEVSVGELIEVRAGERIPLDGVVENGGGYLDTSAITGEPVKKRVAEGDEALSGCISSDGVLLLRVTRPFAESTVSRILKIVEDSSVQKAPTEKFITKFCRYYTPTVVAAAVAVAVVPSLIWGDWAHWIHAALTFLVISCPCALVLSVPLSYFCGIGACSRKGVLVKGGVYLETAAKLSGVAFDKTGTLTYGDFQVREIVPESAADPILECCAAAEYYSNHPVAEAVRERFQGKIDPSDLSGFSEIAGRGVTVCYRGRKVLAGNRKFFEENGIAAVFPQTSGTEIHVACDGQYLGTLTVSDRIKENSALAIEALKKAGIPSLALLTGDAEKPAREIASELGISDVYPALLPKDKTEVFQNISKDKVYAFVGDGINDAPVLTVAPIGISVGGLGSDAAVEASDVVLMRDDLSGITVLKEIGRKTCRIVKGNVAMVLFIKFIAMALGVLGILPMWGAVFADVGACLLAILNTTLFLSGKKDRQN